MILEAKRSGKKSNYGCSGEDEEVGEKEERGRGKVR